MKEEIEELIKSGFSLELISFELDIPIEQLKRYKINLENNRLARKNNIDKGNGKNQSYSKISEMREKYKELYFKVIKMKLIDQSHYYNKI